MQVLLSHIYLLMYFQKLSHLGLTWSYALMNNNNVYTREYHACIGIQGIGESLIQIKEVLCF